MQAQQLFICRLKVSYDSSLLFSPGHLHRLIERLTPIRSAGLYSTPLDLAASLHCRQTRLYHFSLPRNVILQPTRSSRTVFLEKERDSALIGGVTGIHSDLIPSE